MNPWLAVDAACLRVRSLGLHHERVDPDPQQGEDGSQQNRPDDNNGGCSVLPTHQTLEERVEMDNDPEREEQLPKQRTPRLVPVVDGIRDSGDNSDDVDDEDGGGRDEKGGPLEGVELSEVLVVGGFGGDGEVGVDSCEDLEEALDDGEEVGGDSADDPKLLVPPPLLDAHSAPTELEDAGGNDGEEKPDEVEACPRAYLQNERVDLVFKLFNLLNLPQSCH